MVSKVEVSGSGLEWVVMLFADRVARALPGIVFRPYAGPVGGLWAADDEVVVHVQREESGWLVSVRDKITGVEVEREVPDGLSAQEVAQVVGDVQDVVGTIWACGSVPARDRIGVLVRGRSWSMMHMEYMAGWAGDVYLLGGGLEGWIVVVFDDTADESAFGAVLLRSVFEPSARPVSVDAERARLVGVSDPEAFATHGEAVAWGEQVVRRVQLVDAA